MNVPVYHSGDKLAEVRLTPEEFQDLVQYQSTKEPVTVLFIQDKGPASRDLHWTAHITLMKTGPTPYNHDGTMLMFDKNKNNLEVMIGRLKPGVNPHSASPKDFIMVYSDKIPLLDDEYRKGVRYLRGHAKSQAREDSARRAFKLLLELARQYNAIVCFEALNFQKLKAQVQGKSAKKMIHSFMTGKTREMVIRLCKVQGVPYAAVNAAYTTLAGGLFTPYHQGLSRDAGSCIPIGLLATSEGREYLNNVCLNAVKTKALYRTTNKGVLNLTKPLNLSAKQARTVILNKGRQPKQRATGLKLVKNPFYSLGAVLKSLNQIVRLGKPGKPSSAGTKPKSPDAGYCADDLVI